MDGTAYLFKGLVCEWVMPRGGWSTLGWSRVGVNGHKSIWIVYFHLIVLLHPNQSSIIISFAPRVDVITTTGIYTTNTRLRIYQIMLSHLFFSIKWLDCPPQIFLLLFAFSSTVRVYFNSTKITTLVLPTPHPHFHQQIISFRSKQHFLYIPPCISQ